MNTVFTVGKQSGHKSLIFVFLCIFGVFANAAPVSITSYSYNVSPSSSYRDSTGSELSDGIKFVDTWGNGNVLGSGDIAPFVGWFRSTPSITFNFASGSFIDEVILYIADSNGTAGVGIPLSVRLQEVFGGVGFDRTFAIDDPLGSGDVKAFVFSNLGLTTEQFSISMGPRFVWTMLTEVEFFSTSSSQALSATFPISSFGFLTFLGLWLARRNTKRTV